MCTTTSLQLLKIQKCTNLPQIKEWPKIGGSLKRIKPSKLSTWEKKNCQFKDHPVVQCDMKHKANPEEEMKKLYPVHDFDAIILTGLVVVLQGIKLMLNSFFCAKLEHRSHRLTTCYIKKKEKNQSVKWWWCSFLHDQMLTFNLGPKGFFLRDSNL